MNKKSVMPTMESVDRFKAAMDSDRGALGPFMICTDPAMVEAAGHAGYDFVLLDMEHGTTTFQELPNLIRAANVTGVCPVVRVPRGSDIWIDQALDVGAGAVMIPQIDTAEQARAAVSAAKFSPVGTRGTCRFVRSAGFGAVPGSEYFSRAQDTVVILQAEGQKAIDNLDEILDVPGIDVVFVGPYDLSSSLGHVGEIDHPEVIAAIKQIIAKAAAKLIYAFHDMTAPKVNVIVGAANGTASLAMNNSADMTYAWPQATIGMMDPVSAAKIMYADDKDADLAEKAAQFAAQSGTEAAAARGYVDSVIEPASARKQLLYAFEMLYNKCEYPIGKKHGTI